MELTSQSSDPPMQVVAKGCDLSDEVVPTVITFFLMVFQSGPGSAEDCPFGKTCLEGPCNNDTSDYIVYCDCPPDTNTYEVGAPDISYCRGMHLHQCLLLLPPATEVSGR